MCIVLPSIMYVPGTLLVSCTIRVGYYSATPEIFRVCPETVDKILGNELTLPRQNCYTHLGYKTLKFRALCPRNGTAVRTIITGEQFK